MSSSLRHIRVLDLTRLLPGPYATSLLADLGADVLKVESPAKPDYLRFFPPPAELAFRQLNRNKRSLLLAWETPEGAAVLRQLAARCDVLVESFRSGYLKRFGLDPASLPDTLVYCSMSGYGQHDSRAGHDLNFLARSGLGAGLSHQGAPVVPQVQIADMTGGMTAALAILAALVERQQTGRGRHLDVALTDAPEALTLLQSAAALQGYEETTIGTLTGAVPGYRYYRCQDDRWLAMGALEDNFRSKVCTALGIEGEGWLEPGPGLEDLFASQPREHWLGLLEGLDACVEPVLGPSEGTRRVPARTAGDEQFPGGLLDASFPASGPDRPAARPGQHTREILQEFGLDVESLLAAGTAMEEPA